MTGAAPGLEHAPCPLCGTSTAEVVLADGIDRRHGTPGRFAVVECTDCGLCRTDPRPTREAIGDFYPAEYSSFRPDAVDDPRGPRRALRRLVRLPYNARHGGDETTPRPSKPHAAFLDIGCGTGARMHAHAALGWEVWGIEPAPDVADAAARATGVPPERIFVGRAEDATFASGSFDRIALSHVLEHLHDPVAVLERVGKWLTPDGVVAVWVPNVASLESRIFRRYWFGLDLPRHLVHFTPATLDAMLRRAGLVPIASRPQFQVPSLAGSVRIVADALLGRDRPSPESPTLYFTLMPVASLLAACGNAAVLELTARRAA